MSSKTIWKFEFGLHVEHRQLAIMPEGAEILSVQAQHGKLSLWAIVDPAKPMMAREFSVYGTGHPVPENPGRYIDMVQQLDGQLVWHVFESTP